MLKSLKKEVYAANKQLPKLGLVSFTWGNVSGICRDKGLVVIKPSGISYKNLTPDDMVVVDLSGRVVEGKLKPSSDTATHLRLYSAFPEIGGVAHTHSTFATAFAQAGVDLLAYGTTHADYFHGSVPCTRPLRDWEVQGEYELETGNVIAETFGNLDPTAMPGVLVNNHGPFAWGKTPTQAVMHIAVMEECARMAYISWLIKPDIVPVGQAILDKHYFRKHGATATYGN